MAWFNYLLDISKRDMNEAAQSTFARATLYTGPRVVRRNTKPLASVLRRVQRPDTEQGPPEKPCKAPVFGLQCNVSYVAACKVQPPFFFGKTDGGGEGAPGAQEYPRKNFYNL